MEISLYLMDFLDFFYKMEKLICSFSFSSGRAVSKKLSLVFKIFFQLHGLKDTERSALNLAEFRNQVHYRTFLRE